MEVVASESFFYGRLCTIHPFCEFDEFKPNLEFNCVKNYTYRESRTTDIRTVEQFNAGHPFYTVSASHEI